MIIMVIGVSGSGKTTVGMQLAKELGWQFWDADDFHPPENVNLMERGIALTDTERWPWLETVHAQMQTDTRTHKSTVWACSALKVSYRKVLSEGLPELKFVYLNGSKALILSRLRTREGHFMPASLLDSQFEALEEPSQEEALWVGVSQDLDEIIHQIKSSFL